jgi:hypothetical protein
MKASFDVSTRIADAIAFGGEVNNVVFSGELTRFKKWDDCSSYTQDCPSSDGELLLGYVVYNEDTNEVVQFIWGESDAVFWATSAAEDNGNEYSIGRVIVEEQQFIEFARRTAAYEESLE